MPGVVSGSDYLIYWIGMGAITIGVIVAAVIKMIFKK